MDKTKDNSPYLNYADPLRVFAILSVIALHASAVRVVHLPEVHSLAWWSAHSIDSLCRWVVPIFVMMSGALNLDLTRNYPLAKFYTKRFSRVVIPLLFWGSVYFVWSAKFYGMDVSWEFITTSLKSGLTYNHLYFLFIIIGLSAVTPILRFILKVVPYWGMWILTAGLMYVTANGLFFQHIPMNALTRFTPYIAYYFLGYLLRCVPLKKSWGLLCGLGFLAASCTIILKTYFLVDQYGREDYRAFVMYDHFNIFVVLQSVFVYLCAQAFFPGNANSIVEKTYKKLASISFGVYLVHVIFLDVLRGYTAALNAQYTLLIIALEVIVVYAISTVLSLGIVKIPYVRRVIGE